MKKRIALAAVIAASALAYAAVKSAKTRKMSAQKPEGAEPIKPVAESLPKLPEASTLSPSLLESYRVQCKVMMDGYPSDKSIDIVHHVEFKDPLKLKAFAEASRNSGQTVSEDTDRLAVTLRKTITTDAQTAYREIVKVAESALAQDGLYQGWILENCR